MGFIGHFGGLKRKKFPASVYCFGAAFKQGNENFFELLSKQQRYSGGEEWTIRNQMDKAVHSCR